MSGLQLVPNEVVGYRIKPDWYNFKVVLVKKKGPASKEAGKEYEDVLGYCRSLQFAVDYIIQHATRMYGEEFQDATEAQKKSIADAKALNGAIIKAQASAHQAVAELQARIDALGLTSKDLVKLLGDPEAAEAAAASAAADAAAQ